MVSKVCRHRFRIFDMRQLPTRINKELDSAKLAFQNPQHINAMDSIIFLWVFVTAVKSRSECYFAFHVFTLS